MASLGVQIRMLRARAAVLGGARVRTASRACIAGALAVIVLSPVTVLAAPLPGTILVGFEEQYEREGRGVVHHGVDVMMPAGTMVPCLRGGRVVFAGVVPAGPGHSTHAVTVEDDEGRRWSYMPFDHVDVREDTPIEEGMSLGTLARSGDPSSDAAHLHVGLRIDGEYSDPVPVLGLDPVPPAETQSPAEPTAESPLASALAPPSMLAPEPVRPVVSVSAGEARLADVAATTANPDGQASSTDTRPTSNAFDAHAVVVRDRQSAPVRATQAEATVSAAPPVAETYVTVTILGTVVLGGVCAGAARFVRNLAPSKVGADPGPTRLQPR